MVPAEPYHGPDEDTQKLIEKQKLYSLEDDVKYAKKLQGSPANSEPKPIESGSEKKTK